jgi:hypothetical protein
MVDEGSGTGRAIYRLPASPGVSSERAEGLGLAWLVCFPVDVDSGGFEIGAVGASALAGGQHGDGEECVEDGAAVADVESVGAVGVVPYQRSAMLG